MCLKHSSRATAYKRTKCQLTAMLCASVHRCSICFATGVRCTSNSIGFVMYRQTQVLQVPSSTYTNICYAQFESQLTSAFSCFSNPPFQQMAQYAAGAGNRYIACLVGCFHLTQMQGNVTDVAAVVTVYFSLMEILKEQQACKDKHFFIYVHTTYVVFSIKHVHGHAEL